MTRHLVLSFRFLAPWFHGRGDEGAPEWPPSPLRAFQAIVAAAARAGTLESTRAGLAGLEQRPAPLIMASEATESPVGYRLSVPHNAMDLVARQWSRGAEGNAAEHRAMKSVRPQRLPEDAVVHYAWQLGDDLPDMPALIAAARGVVALGWGVDLVVGNGSVVDGAGLAALSARLTVWEPRSDGRDDLRTPTEGSLEDLGRRHAAFMTRTSLADPTLRPPPPLSTFAITSYSRANESPASEIAGFTLMRLGSDKFRAFDAVRHGSAVASMVRHAVRNAAERAGWDEARVCSTVLGQGDGEESRLVMVPVPSIEPRANDGEAVGAVRRVMLFSTDHRSRDTAWASRVLGGMDLIDERTGEVVAVLAATPRKDGVLGRYCRAYSTWATVTPVLLPGHDDPGGILKKLSGTRSGEVQRSLLERLMKRREALVRKALRHAGIGDELSFSARIEIRPTGFIAGVEKASRYTVPTYLANAPRFHVKLTWSQRVAGPLCIGRGRFAGLGLFVGVEG